MPDISPVLLLVTWFVAGQLPASYQVEFTRAEKCDRVKEQLYMLRNAMEADYMREPLVHLPSGTVLTKQPAPNLIALCAPK